MVWLPSFMRDGALANILTGRGTSVDRSTHNFWTANTMPPQQIEAAYRNSWLVRQIVDIPADDQTRAGRDWQAEKEQITKIEAEEKRLCYWQKVRQALIFGRLGGGALFINLGDDPARPLPASIRPEQIQSLVPLYRTQITLGAMDDDLLSPFYGEPSEFRVNTPARPAIHRSRLIIFKGQMVPGIHAATWDDRFWGDSIVQTINEAVQNATTATGGFASLIDEAKVDVFTFKGLVDILSGPDGEKKFMERLQVTATGKSMHRMVALGEGDTWETRTVNWAGMPDVVKTYLSIVAGAADIPATRLLGKSADGMNATGEGDLTNYFQSVSAQQESDLRPSLERLDAIVLPSAGVKGDLTWSFSPLRVLSEKEQAEIENKEADTVSKVATSAMIPESALAKAVQNRLIESQRWPGLQEAIAEAEAAGEGLPEGDETELGIVPTGSGKEGIEPSAGGGAERPARRAANDADVQRLRQLADSNGMGALFDELFPAGGTPNSDRPFDDARQYSRWPAGSPRGGQFKGGSGKTVSGPVRNAATILALTGVDVSKLTRIGRPTEIAHALKTTSRDGRSRLPPSRKAVANYARHAEKAYSIKRQGSPSGSGLRIRSEVMIAGRHHTIIERVGAEKGELALVTMWRNG